MLFIRNVNIFIPTLISDEILTDSAKLITGNGIFCKLTESIQVLNEGSDENIYHRDINLMSRACSNIFQVLLCVCSASCNTASHCTLSNLFLFTPRPLGQIQSIAICSSHHQDCFWSPAPANPARPPW